MQVRTSGRRCLSPARPLPILPSRLPIKVTRQFINLGLNLRPARTLLRCRTICASVIWRVVSRPHLSSTGRLFSRPRVLSSGPAARFRISSANSTILNITETTLRCLGKTVGMSSVSVIDIEFCSLFYYRTARFVIGRLTSGLAMVPSRVFRLQMSTVWVVSTTMTVTVTPLSRLSRLLNRIRLLTSKNMTEPIKNEINL